MINPPTVSGALSVNYFNVCSFPMDGFITPMLQTMKTQKDDNSSTALMLSMGFMFIKGPEDQIGSDGWYHPSGATDTRTGEPIVFKCK